jgi:hypothetical protein
MPATPPHVRLRAARCGSARVALASVCAQGLPRAALHGKVICGSLRHGSVRRGVVVSPGTAQTGVLPGSQAICSRHARAWVGLSVLEFLSVSV